MKANIGNADRVVRILAGLGLVAFMTLAPANVRWWGLLGFVLLLTAFVGSCPLYSLAGFDTRGKQR